MIVLLDAGPLGMVTNPHGSPENDACRGWLRALLASGVRVVIPEIADYEIRRELLRADKTAGLARLDALIATVDYAPISTQAMRQAAEFWAQARKRGRPTADEKALDADMILVAQAAVIAGTDEDPVIATTNVQHLDRFARARLWQDVS